MRNVEPAEGGREGEGEGFSRHDCDVAYRATTYRLHLDAACFDLRIGLAHPAFRAWLQSRESDKFAIITAYNPASVQLGFAENAERQRRLENELRQLACLAGQGENLADDTGWPVEPSCLALGLSWEEARRLGAAYGQNAVLVGGGDAIPRLLWIEEDK